jgi:hypothetical protein
MKFIITLAAVIMCQSSFSEVFSPKTKEVVGNAYLSSFVGGLASAGTLGQGALGLALIQSAVVLGVTYGAEGITESITPEQHLKMVKAVILKESNDFHTTGEIGLVLSAAIKSLQISDTDLSDAEAVDQLIKSLKC